MSFPYPGLNLARCARETDALRLGSGEVGLPRGDTIAGNRHGVAIHYGNRAKLHARKDSVDATMIFVEVRSLMLFDYILKNSLDLFIR